MPLFCLDILYPFLILKSVSALGTPNPFYPLGYIFKGNAFRIIAVWACYLYHIQTLASQTHIDIIIFNHYYAGQ